MKSTAKPTGKVNLEHLERLLRAALSHPHGPGGLLEDAEIARGATLIPLGATSPFHFDEKDWLRGVVSLKDSEVRIVAIEARKPRGGALRRLIQAIQAAGLRPAIVAAMLDMPAILKHWGWVMTREAEPDGHGSYDVWRPPAP